MGYFDDDEDGEFGNLGLPPGAQPSPNPKRKRGGTRRMERIFNLKAKAARDALQSRVRKPVAPTDISRVSRPVVPLAPAGIISRVPVSAIPAGVVSRLPTQQGLPLIVTEVRAPSTPAGLPVIVSAVPAPAPVTPTRISAVAPAPVVTTASRIGSRLAGIMLETFEGLFGAPGLSGFFDDLDPLGIDQATADNIDDQGNPITGTDPEGVPAGWTAKNQAYVSGDVWATLHPSEVWHFDGKRATHRFAWPAIDLSHILCWKEFDEYGKFDPQDRYFDNCRNLPPEPADRAAQYGYDDLRWDLHPPTGSLLGGRGRLGGVNYGRPYTPMGGKGDPKYIQLQNLTNGMTKTQADLTRVDGLPGDWDWFDPKAPFPIDLWDYAVHGMVPDEFKGMSAEEFWSTGPGSKWMFQNISGARLPTGVPGLIGEYDLDSRHDGRMYPTVYFEDDVPRGIIHLPAGTLTPAAPCPDGYTLSADGRSCVAVPLVEVTTPETPPVDTGGATCPDGYQLSADGKWCDLIAPATDAGPGVTEGGAPPPVLDEPPTGATPLTQEQAALIARYQDGGEVPQPEPGYEMQYAPAAEEQADLSPAAQEEYVYEEAYPLTSYEESPLDDAEFDEGTGLYWIQDYDGNWYWWDEAAQSWAADIAA